MGLIREELYKVAKNWNLHKIRPSNTDTPHGRPDTLFFSQRRRELRISKRTLT